MVTLALVHEQGPQVGVFADSAEEHGAAIEEWSFAWGTPPPRPLDEYDAVFVFGGVMNTDDEQYHPWLREETMVIQRFLDQGVPFLGVCLGGQLLAKAAHASVARARAPEVGWHPVELLPDAAGDPLFSRLPPRLMAYQWHHYSFELPGGAVPLAQSDVCLQAFRLGEQAWGLQFHCEVDAEIVELWTSICEARPDHDEPGFDPARIRAETPLYIDAWNDVGRELSSRFLEVAARAKSGAAA